jgi:hypothetical protein
MIAKNVRTAVGSSEHFLSEAIMNPERFSIFLTDLSAWSTNPPPCAEPTILDAPTETDDKASPAAAPRGAIALARRAALNSKIKDRLAQAKREDDDRDSEILEIPVLDEDDDMFAFDSDPVQY